MIYADLVTQPILAPVKVSQSHQSKLKGLLKASDPDFVIVCTAHYFC